MGKVKLVASLSEWEISAMNHQLLGLVENLEGGGKKPLFAQGKELSGCIYTVPSSFDILWHFYRSCSG